MQDRVPTPGQEGRALITPEDGSTPFYAKVEMADNPTQSGTPLIKANLLSDDTVESFGEFISPVVPEQPVPNDALKATGLFINSDRYYRRTLLNSHVSDGEAVYFDLSGINPLKQYEIMYLRPENIESSLYSELLVYAIADNEIINDTQSIKISSNSDTISASTSGHPWFDVSQYASCKIHLILYSNNYLNIGCAVTSIDAVKADFVLANTQINTHTGVTTFGINIDRIPPGSILRLYEVD